MSEPVKSPTPTKPSNFWSFTWQKFRKGDWNSLKKGLGGLRDEYQAYLQESTTVQSVYENYDTLVGAARDNLDYYILLITSCLIASFGLLQNSAAVIIGAMIVAPLMGPITAFSASVLWGRWQDIGMALLTLLKSSIVVLAITVTLSVLLPEVVFNEQLLARTSPGLFDIGVALASGLVGAYGAINRKVSGSLSGVAIAVALMPPLSTVGLALGRGLWAYAGAAAVLFAINILGISLAALFVFWIFGLHPVTKDEGTGKVQLVRRAVGQIVISLLALAAIAVPMVSFSRQALEKDQLKIQVEQRVRALIPEAALGDLTWISESPPRVRLLVYGAVDLQTLDQLERELSRLHPEGIEVKLYSVGEVSRPMPAPPAP